jgi:hypothetical protein
VKDPKDPELKVVPFKKNCHKAWLPSEFLKREDVNAEDKGILAILCGYMDKSGCCWPTHPELERKVGFGHCKLEEKLRSLKKRGFIAWTHWWDEYGHRRNRYQMLFLRNPTPTNQLLATPLKPVVKHIAIYPEGVERLEEEPVKYEEIKAVK